MLIDFSLASSFTRYNIGYESTRITLFKQQRNTSVIYTYIENFPICIFEINTEN